MNKGKHIKSRPAWRRMKMSSVRRALGSRLLKGRDRFQRVMMFRKANGWE